MVGVGEGREFRFRGDLYSQENTFPLVLVAVIIVVAVVVAVSFRLDLSYSLVQMLSIKLEDVCSPACVQQKPLK